VIGWLHESGTMQRARPRTAQGGGIKWCTNRQI
jgi:hypothetical protein